MENSIKKLMMDVDTSSKIPLLRIYSETIEMIGRPEYIYLLLGNKSNELLIRAAKNEIPVRKECKINYEQLKEKGYCELFIGITVQIIANMMGISEKGIYSIEGIYDSELKSVVFNLQEHIEVVDLSGFEIVSREQFDLGNKKSRSE